MNPQAQPPASAFVGAAAFLQKSVRDRLEGIPVTGLYFGLAWMSLGLSIMLLVVGLWNAELTSSEKSFCAMSFVLSLFAAIAAQKNVRDVAGLGRRPVRSAAPRGGGRTERPRQCVTNKRSQRNWGLLRSAASFLCEKGQAVMRKQIEHSVADNSLQPEGFTTCSI